MAGIILFGKNGISWSFIGVPACIIGIIRNQRLGFVGSLKLLRKKNINENWKESKKIIFFFII